MTHFSHRDYFREYRLNVEQYGEILIADAFHGQKMGDSQPAYDVEVDYDSFLNVLEALGVDTRKFIANSHEKIRIEVKSKLSRTPTGLAYVVNCSDTKLNGRCSKTGKQFLCMTHMAVVLVDPGIQSCDEYGRIASAWLLSVETAKKMRLKPGKTQYVSVSQLRDEPRSDDYVEITKLLDQAACKIIERTTEAISKP